jgi:hypothetical protein
VVNWNVQVTIAASPSPPLCVRGAYYPDRREFLRRAAQANHKFGGVEPTDVSVHFGILGQIHEQVEDLPPGAEIGEIKFE